MHMYTLIVRVWPWINILRHTLFIQGHTAACSSIIVDTLACLQCFGTICQILWKNNLKSFCSVRALNTSHPPPNAHSLGVKPARHWLSDNRWAVLYMLQLVPLWQVTTRWDHSVLCLWTTSVVCLKRHTVQTCPSRLVLDVVVLVSDNKRGLLYFSLQTKL